jgi:hypothetical protein
MPLFEQGKQYWNYARRGGPSKSSARENWCNAALEDTFLGDLIAIQGRWRLQAGRVTHHVIQRGGDRQTIFFSDSELAALSEPAGRGGMRACVRAMQVRAATVEGSLRALCGKDGAARSLRIPSSAPAPGSRACQTA